MTDQFTTDLKNLLALADKEPNCSYVDHEQWPYIQKDMDADLGQQLRLFIDTHRSTLEGMVK